MGTARILWAIPNPMHENSPSQGFIYVAEGERCIKEAVTSAKSLRNALPSAHITAFLAEPPGDTSVFDTVIDTKGEFNRLTKIQVFLRTPYERSVFLDADTWICGDPSSLFSVLDEFELAAALAPQDVKRVDARIPDCFPEFNSGVIAFRRSETVIALANEWLTEYRRFRATFPAGWVAPDQPSFRYALYKSRVRIGTLTNRYNCRISMPGFVMTPVVILHGRCTNLSQLARPLTEPTWFRLRAKRKLYFRLGNRVLVLPAFQPSLSPPAQRKVRAFAADLRKMPRRVWMFFWKRKWERGISLTSVMRRT